MKQTCPVRSWYAETSEDRGVLCRWTPGDEDGKRGLHRIWIPKERMVEVIVDTLTVAQMNDFLTAAVVVSDWSISFLLTWILGRTVDLSCNFNAATFGD